MDDEAQLIERAQGGDPHAFDLLVCRYSRYICRCSHVLANLSREDAEDITNDVLIRLFAALPSFRPQAPFKAWLRGLIRYVAFKHLRTKYRQPRLYSLDDPRIMSLASEQGVWMTDAARDNVDPAAELMSRS